MRPWVLIDSIEYSEQEGVNLHLGPMSGDTKSLYSLIKATGISLVILMIVSILA